MVNWNGRSRAAVLRVHVLGEATDGQVKQLSDDGSR
jgi:hypothetical protein